MEVIARFDRGAHEEVRISLAEQQGRPYLDVRVYHKWPLGGAAPSPEGIRLPLELFGALGRAIEAAGGQLRRRAALSPEEPAAPPGVDTRSTLAPAPGGGRLLSGSPERPGGRAEARLPLTCPLEYTVRGASRGREDPLLGRGRTADISRGGMQVLLPQRVSVLNVLLVTLQMPWGFLSLVGEVVWAQLSRAAQPAGGGVRHGLRFTDVGPQERHVLDQLLEQATR